MHGEDSDLEVFLVPVGDDVVLAVPAGDLESLASEARPKLASLFSKASPLIAAALERPGDLNARGAALFEMSTDSYQKYKDARLDEVGAYFRGVLRTSKGQASHQVQLREVQQTQMPVGFNTIVAAQMAAIQAQLDRIENTLADLATSVSEVMRFLEVQQRAEIEAALRAIRKVHDRARSQRSISDTDWARIVGLEQVLEKQLIAVRIELQSRLQNPKFGGTPEDDRQQIDEINPDRVAELVHGHQLLAGGLRGWNELLALRKHQEGELTAEEVSDITTRLKELRAQQEDVRDAIGMVASPAQEARPRGNIQRLLKDGIVMGAKNDAENLAAIAVGRETLKKLNAAQGSPAPTSLQPRMLVLTEDHGTEPGEALPNPPAQDSRRQRKGDPVVDDLHHE